MPQLFTKMVMSSLWLLTVYRGKLTKLIASTSREGNPILHGIISVSYETRFRELYYSEQRENSTPSSNSFSFWQNFSLASALP